MARIMVVEDEVLQAQHFCRLLGDEGHEILPPASSGEEALECGFREAPDLVLMDVVLAGAVDGLEAGRILIERLGIPIVFMSVRGDRETLERIQAMKAEAYLLKPFHETELIATVGLSLDRRAAARRARQQAARASQRHEALLKNIPDVVWTLHESGRLLYASERIRDLCGLDPEEAPPLVHLAHPEDRPRVEAALARMFRTGSPYSEQYRLRQKDGSWVTVHDRATHTYQAEDGLCADGLCTDVTRRVELESHLQQFQKLEALGRLAGGVAHDFNNLLTAIRGFAEMLLEGRDPDHPEALAAREIVQAAQRGASLTQQLLAFSRGQLVSIHPVQLNALVEGMERLLKRLLGEPIHLVTRLSPGVGNVLADPNQVEQVLMNLALNGRDAMPMGGTLRIETLAPPEMPEFRILAVEDTGTGIPEEDLPRIFDPFFTTKPIGHGTGLGLASVYGIARKLGGDVRVTSQVGRGTRFEILLPHTVLVRSEDRPAGRAASSPAPRGTVLLVEDEDPVRRLAGQILRRSGYAVLEAADAEEALRLFEDRPVDLLLTDTVMPGMSGPQLACELLRRNPALRCVYMSGYSEDETLRHGLRTEAVSFLAKPFGPRELLERVQEALVPAGAG